tara:strand:+ start:1076 stop:1564 length:489 start_codon:yes stop_codon:yes gene_type:complete
MDTLHSAYIPTDIDGDYQEEYYNLITQEAYLLARSWHQCYAKINKYYPELFRNNNLLQERIIGKTDIYTDYLYEDQFVDYVKSYLGGLDDEFADYDIDLGKRLNVLLEQASSKPGFNNHIINRFKFFTSRLNVITNIIAMSPFYGRRKAEELRKDLGLTEAA